MPTYQYACKQCGEGLEVQQSFTDDALTECPSCGGVLRKVFNAVGVVFKGSGFYRNDSRGSTSTSEAGSSSSSSEGGSGSSDKSSSGGDKSSSSGEKSSSTGSKVSSGSGSTGSSGSSSSAAS